MGEGVSLSPEDESVRREGHGDIGGGESHLFPISFRPARESLGRRGSSASRRHRRRGARPVIGV